MSTTAETRTGRVQLEHVDYKRLLWVGPLAIFGSAILNVLLRELLVLVGAVTQDHALLSVPGVFAATAIQVAIGVGVFALMGKFARRPISTFRTVAIVVLLLSFLQPIMGGLGLFVPPISGNVSFAPAIVISMMLMHIVAGLFTIWVLTTQAREK
jgi:hypothetical protein